MAATLVILLLLGLALSQAWLLWFLRRQVARLDQRVDESLDAEDLVEFQEQLQGLLEQVKEAGLELAQSLEIRHAAVGKAVDKARDAEQKLAVRLQAMEKVAEGLTQRLKHAEQAAANAAPAKKTGAKAKDPDRTRKDAKPGSSHAVQSPPPLQAPAVAPPPAAPPAPQPAPQLETAAEAAGRARSYLSRPATQPRHQRVYELADQGWSREQIAKEAGLLPGEVDLILNLRRQRPAQG